MPSLLTSDEIDNLTGVMGDHFDTFSRNIVIYKSPIQTISASDVNPMPGYPLESVESVITTTQVSGVYPAVIIYNKHQETAQPGGKILAKGEVVIKVEEDAKNFIKNGKTEAFVIDDIVFNSITDEAITNFLGLRFYLFGLERTN